MLERVWRRELSYSISGNVNWCMVLQRTVWRFLKNLKLELPYDPIVLLLGMYLEKTIIWKYTWTSVFTAALLTIAKTWKQLKCPTATKKWIKKIWYIYAMEYYSAIKNNEIMSLATKWMDFKKSEKDKYHMLSLYFYMWHLKIWYKWTYLQNRNRLPDFKNKLMVP